jgi:hypothetical protein
VIIREWCPPQERPLVNSIIFSGIYGGAVVGFPLSSLIGHYCGEPCVYYAFGESCKNIQIASDFEFNSNRLF